ncbi:MAG: hypothetical protein IJA60_07855 [Clostridia bacterium]|nr:hypothetical protein [Clostridia bacterium]
MKKSFVILICVFICTCLMLFANAADTVYLNGSATADANVYTDIASAVKALPNGGTLIVSGDTTIGTSSKGVTLAAVGGKITVKSENNAKLILARTFTVNSEFEFVDINIHSTATALANIYANGNKITIGDTVKTSVASGAMWPALFGGAGNAAVTYNTHLVINGGTWRAVYGGNYMNTLNGTSTVEISNAIVTGTLSAGNYQGTCNATKNVLIDLRGYKTVSAGTYKETPTILTDEGCEAVLSDKVYSQVKTYIAPTTVYVDESDSSGDAYTSITAAYEALANEGGTVIIKGDVNLGTSSASLTLPAKSGKVTIKGEDGARLLLNRSLFFTSETEITDIALHSTNTLANILAQGNKLTISDTVSVTKTDGAVWPALFGGATAKNVSYNTHLVINGGTWRAIYGANYDNSFSGKSTLEVSGAVSTGTISAKNYTGTHSGDYELIFNLCGGKTVSAKTFKEIPTLVCDDGYEGVLIDGMYMQRVISDMEPKVVYVDGTGNTSGAYTSLSVALAGMGGGGTVVVSGDTEITSDVILPKTKEILITSKYGDEDYTSAARLKMAANITLGSDTTFKDITLERTLDKSGNLYIIAAGNRLTVDTGVICLNYTALQNLSLVGGHYSTDYKGDTHITVKSGMWRNIFGGNYEGAFIGNTYVEMLGGTVVNSLVGGNYNSDFTGDSHITFAGNASIVYTASTQGIVGGNLGDGGSKKINFNGNIYMTLGGECGINHNVIGASRNSNAYTKGDVEITIADNAYSYYSVYAGGYSNGLDGNTKVVVNGGDINGSLFGGAYAGTVTGNTYIEINGGKLCYYRVNIFSSGSEPVGTKNVFGGGATGSMVNGTATIVMNGGSVYGDIFGGSYDGASTVNGASSIKLTNGTVYGKISADITTIDLSAGGNVEIDAPSSISELIGGGKLCIVPATRLRIGTISGITNLTINGVPLPVDYITATTVEDGAVINYLPQENETLVLSDNTYSIDFEGACDSTVVTVEHKEDFSVRLRKGSATTGNWFTPNSTTDTTAVYTLTPGLYTVTVVSNTDGGNYKRISLYVDGRSETKTVNMVFDKRNEDGFDYGSAYFKTKEIEETYYNPEDIEGYFTPDTPYFNKRYRTTNAMYTTNDELAEFLAEKKAACDYMYIYSVATSPYGYDVPLVLFTKDELPENATLEEAAKAVGKLKGRDILLITAGVHGNESTGTEGALAFISEMCGEYGSAVFDGTNVGAVVVLPRLNPDGFRDFIRETPNPTLESNLNRDYMALSSAEISGAVYAYRLFMPTFTLDCHEALANPLWSEGEMLTDVYDAGIKAGSNINGYGNPLDIINGNRKASVTDHETVALKALSRMNDMGMRTYYYETEVYPVNNTYHFGLGGSYSFLLELPGINAGENLIARRTFGQLTGIKTLIGIVLEMDGEMARNVNAARAEVSEGVQVYDGQKPIIIDSAVSRADMDRFEWNNILVGSDGEIRVEDNLTYMYDYDTAVKYRALPTAYAFSSEVANADAVLALLDKHGIAYKLLESGLYLVPVDGARAYITAILFENGYADATGFYASFIDMKLLDAGDIYRLTESYIAAKNGIAGTYSAFDIPAGKTLEKATLDGKDVAFGVDGEQAFVALYGEEEYSVILSFTDDSEMIYSAKKGDINEDGIVSIADALATIKAVVNDKYFASADMNGDGSFTLLDVIRIMKAIV